MLQTTSNLSISKKVGRSIIDSSAIMPSNFGSSIAQNFASSPVHTPGKSLPKTMDKDMDSSKISKRIKLPATPTTIMSFEKKMLLVLTEDNTLYLIKDNHPKEITKDNTLTIQTLKNPYVLAFFSTGRRDDTR